MVNRLGSGSGHHHRAVTGSDPDGLCNRSAAHLAACEDDPFVAAGHDLFRKGTGGRFDNGFELIPSLGVQKQHIHGTSADVYGQ